MKRLEGDWVTRPATQAVFDALEAQGGSAFFVGGCVRDALMGRDVGDIDLATALVPDVVTEAAEAAGLNAIPTGLDHGTITVVSDGVPHEVTTFRRDVETDGRRAVVAFSDQMDEDAARRDFTMNALYADRKGLVIDPLGGLPDLEARLVVFIGEAADRIAEDHLRILRFFRFHAWFAAPGFDADALGAIAGGLDGLERLSRERIGAEMLKLLAAPDPASALATMERIGVLARILPGADAAPLGPLVEAEQAAGRAPDALLRLVSLGGTEVDERLRLSRKEAGVVAEMRAAMGETDAAATAYYRGARAAWAGALLQGRMNVGDQIAKGERAEFPVSAADFMDRFEGPALGAKLREVEARWVASGFALTADELRKD